MRSFFSVLALLFCLACASKPVLEDTSNLALKSGQATMLLGGGCERPMALGYDSCQISAAEPMPSLSLTFLNPGEYAVSDCSLGIYKTGNIDGPGTVAIDLSMLQEQVRKYKFCLLRVEAVERYPDPHDPKQYREVPFAGGFFVEVLNKDYIPTPSEGVVSWCYKVRATNKGRRTLEKCE